jgi:putative Holliday junction resolvase
MKFLGVDYGTKRIGLAISDDGGRLAFPKEILLNDENIFKNIGEILKKEKIGEIVVGESVDFSGKLNALSVRIELFISDLIEKFNIPVHKQKEFLTSVEARKGGATKETLTQKQSHSRLKDKKRGHIDASAAALILQRYLDKKHITNNI